MAWGIRMRKPRVDWFIVITSLVFAVSCSGGGCGGCGGFEPIPGGFPSAKRTPNATQLRVSQSGLAAIAANPAGLLGSIAGGMNGILKFNAPANCGGSTPICCPNGMAINPCGPIDIDLNKQTGDLPRLELKPASGASRLDVTVRARVKTEMDIPVKIPLVGNCGVKIDTTAGSTKDIQIDAPISFVQDATAGTTKVAVGTVALSNLASEDVALTGGFGCDLANLGLSFFINTLAGQLTSAVQGAIQDQTCKKCPSGQLAECGSPFATACTGGVCQEGNACFQELGLDGRARGSSLFASLSPGTTGALDLYAVAGGYATSNNNGLALGLLGGMQPGGVQRDRCGPPGTAPSPVTIAQSAFFQGNTRPDTNQAFDVAIGLHKSQLAELAYAGYDGGLLCLTIGHSFAAQLSSDTLSLLSRSLGKLVETNSPMAVGIRPQSQPVIGLGKNTFVDDGNGGKKLSDPLLDVRFTAAELDFFISIDDQWIRAFTVVSDIHLPIGLQVAGMGKLTPVLGDVADAFTNISVKNSEAITESPADLAALFPSLLGVVLPQLSNGLSPISLPSLGGLNLNVTDITSVDNSSFLAIFANLTVAMASPVQTRVALGSIDEAPVDVVRDPKRWASSRQPAVTLELGGDREGLEWSYRIDEGTWSAWSPSARQTITSRVFWLAGVHHVEVRAREIGKPETIDETPVVLELPIGMHAITTKPQVAPFHGTGNGQGCSCDSTGSPIGALPLVFVVLLLMLPWRRVKKLGATVWLAAIACLPGCSCGGSKCDGPCVPGEVAHGSLGRFTSIAGDDSRVMVATYDQLLGDLVVVDATDTANQQLTVVDGIPDGVKATHDGGYRNGIEDPGPDVGAWTSIVLADGKARVAYQDRDNGVLKYAHETSKGKWSTYVLDGGVTGEETGRYASMVIDADGHPAIAYLGLGADDGTGHRNTELRLARGNTRDPGEHDWSTTVIASAPGTCAGICASGESCVAGAAATDPESCAVPTTDCTPGCGSGSVCVTGSCRKEVAPEKIASLATGTGLFASLVLLPDGRLAAAYYDRNKRALMLSVENASGANAFTESTLDADPNGDRGMWSSAVVDGSGTIHVAYQDALGDQLLYTSWNTTPGTPEIVDDGQRTGERTHNVGAAAAIYLVNGTPTIAYQDGLTADVYTATKSGTTWSTTGIATGPLLDGFWLAATTSHGGSPVLAWGSVDPSADPNGSLVVESP